MHKMNIHCIQYIVNYATKKPFPYYMVLLFFQPKSMYGILNMAFVGEISQTQWFWALQASKIVFWRIWALETIVYNLKSIANFGNLNVFCYINEIFLVADIW